MTTAPNGTPNGNGGTSDGMAGLPAIVDMAKHYALSAQAFVFTFRAVAMPQPHADAEFVSCCLVAREHGLNPLTKEIYFMRDKHGKIQALVGVDGWIRKCNEHRQFDGIEFEHIHAPDGTLTAVKCIISRKDRSKPIAVTEYMAECAQERKTAGPWQSHPSRMLRHRALIQCARIAFGFAGIMEPDEFKAWQSGLKDVTPTPDAIPDPDAPAPVAAQPAGPAKATIVEDATADDDLADPEGLANHIREQLADAPAEERADVWESNLDSIGRLPRALRAKLEAAYEELATL